MSFTIEVKEEIIAHSFSLWQKQAFLAGFIKQNGELIVANNQIRLRLSTISNRIARNLIAFTKEFFHGEIIISILQGKTLAKIKIYQLNLIGEIDQFLAFLKIEPLALKDWPQKDSFFWRAYVAGVFISTGSINSPQAKNYHLEMTLKLESDAQFLLKKLKKFGFLFHLLKRTNYRWIIYLKSAPKISDFLKFLDGHQSVWDFENKRIERDIANNINRIQNIDISNQTKIIRVAQRQIQQIELIKRRELLKMLSAKLKLIMELRLEFPEASYKELAEKMTKRGYNITKAGVNNLFRRVQKMAQDIENKNINSE